jgi:hypothetical protein
MAHVQREIHWIVAMILFFLERDAMVDMMFLILRTIYIETR